MLTAHNISKSFNIKKILTDVSFSINPSDRVGLIGPNGSGKSTLLKIIIGQLEADQGSITRNPPDLEIGYLPQAYEFPPGITLGKLISQFSGDPRIIEQELELLARSVSVQPENEEIQNAYDAVLNKLENFQYPQINPQLLLDTFNLADLPEDMLVSHLSGGQKTRLGLALIIIKNPDVLILDEPTNHLDIDMLDWLENWIKSFPGGALIVSHDRTFLDNTVNRIFDLDPKMHTIQKYQGNFSRYLEQFLQAQEKQLAAYRDQVYEIRRMRQDIAHTKNQAYRVEITTTSREPGPRRYAKKVARKAKSREKKLDRYLDSDERVEKPNQSWQMKLEFQSNNHQSQDVLRFENLSAGYSNQKPLIKDLNHYLRYGARIALTGPNGGGKTTLLRTISGQIEPISGSIHLGSNIPIGYMAQEQEALSGQINPLEAIQQIAIIDETDARSFLHYFLFSGDDVSLPIKDLSYGERSRLELATLVMKGCNLLLLDEPINHLDIPSRSRFELALSQFSGTVLAVVHDRYFIQRFASEVWNLDDSGSLTIN